MFLYIWIHAKQSGTGSSQAWLLYKRSDFVNNPLKCVAAAIVGQCHEPSPSVSFIPFFFAVLCRHLPFHSISPPLSIPQWMLFSCRCCLKEFPRIYSTETCFLCPLSTRWWNEFNEIWCYVLTALVSEKCKVCMNQISRMELNGNFWLPCWSQRLH